MYKVNHQFTAIERAAQRQFQWINDERKRLLDKAHNLQTELDSIQAAEAPCIETINSLKAELTETFASLTTMITANDTFIKILREEVGSEL